MQMDTVELVENFIDVGNISVQADITQHSLSYSGCELYLFKAEAG